MKKRNTKSSGTWGLCDADHEGVARLAHMLVGHGPLPGASPRKRKRVKAFLPAIHSALERAGFGEVQAHQITRLVAEELRKAGLI
ncbi:MAG TPA: hypothetical protein VJO15_09705 [Dehalococcoidia bacterium]|nr:hypothetical protein [Dehalococcoidia bacterium]